MSPQAQIKKFGGNVKRGMTGKQLLPRGQKTLVAHIAVMKVKLRFPNSNILLHEATFR